MVLNLLIKVIDFVRRVHVLGLALALLLLAAFLPASVAGRRLHRVNRLARAHVDLVLSHLLLLGVLGLGSPNFLLLLLHLGFLPALLGGELVFRSFFKLGFGLVPEIGTLLLLLLFLEVNSFAPNRPRLLLLLVHLLPGSAHLLLPLRLAHLLLTIRLLGLLGLTVLLLAHLLLLTHLLLPILLTHLLLTHLLLPIPHCAL